MSNIKWTQSALDDLAGIRDFIAKDSEYYAEKFIDDVFSAVGRLEIFPMSGRVIPERNNPDFREVIYGAYRIIYKLVDGNARILSIVHSKRDYNCD